MEAGKEIPVVFEQKFINTWYWTKLCCLSLGSSKTIFLFKMTKGFLGQWNFSVWYYDGGYKPLYINIHQTHSVSTRSEP